MALGKTSAKTAKVKTSVLSVILAKMAEYGQLFGTRYDQITLLLTVDRDSDYFESVESKTTKSGREFFVINLSDPNDPKIKLSLPISGDDSAETFEIWDCTNREEWKTDDGKVIPKGMKKIRCYSVEE